MYERKPLEHGCQWCEYTCEQAAAGGQLEVLRWERENGCPWDEGTCSRAARGGYLKVLQWAREHGCPWSEDLGDNPDWNCCEHAARGGHLEVLKWLREHGYPWDEMSVQAPLGVGTWRCWHGFGSTSARGMR